MTLLKNIKTFIKHLSNNKLYMAVTIIGFAISLTFVITLSIYIKNELSINSTQVNKDRIFRLTRERHSNFSGRIAGWLQNTFPEIENTARIYSGKGIIDNADGKKLKLQYLLADSTFFSVFSFPLIQGNPKYALQTKDNIILSEKMAYKLFGNESPIGKKVIVDTRVAYTVSGVIEDISQTSSFISFDAIINLNSLSDIWGSSEDILKMDGVCNFTTFLLAKPHTDLPKLTPKILEMFKKDFWLYRDGHAKKVDMETLSQTYFSESGGSGLRQNSKKQILIFSIIVLLILLLSVVNYMNLTIAQSGFRAKEIAIKKILGSTRQSLILQHIIETTLLCLLAFGIAIGLSFLSENIFNHLLNTQLHIASNLLSSFMLFGLLFIILVGVISGIIPALLITKLKSVEVIKGGFRRKNKTSYTKVMMVFQYIVVIVLIISAIVIARQTSYMSNHNPGYNTSNIITLENYVDSDRIDGLKNQFLSIPGVKNVSFTQGTPIDGGNNNTFVYQNKQISAQVFEVDSAFFKIMKLQVTPTGTAYDKHGIWLNRTAVKELELDSLPNYVTIQKQNIPVLGVVNDFNYNSMRRRVGPVIIRQENDKNYWNIIIEMNTKNTAETLKKLEEIYKNYTEGLPFDYSFFDDSIQNWYANEKRTSNMVKYFAILSIVIAIMGIFAMSLFFSQQKTKEIGIRKVNGAGVDEIVLLLIKDFVKWVIIAFVIAIPIAYYVLHRWLENFAYKISLHWWIFIVGGIIVLLIALLTVSIQTFKAARQNPIKSLRYE